MTVFERWMRQSRLVALSQSSAWRRRSSLCSPNRRSSLAGPALVAWRKRWRLSRISPALASRARSRRFCAQRPVSSGGSESSGKKQQDRVDERQQDPRLDHRDRQPERRQQRLQRGLKLEQLLAQDGEPVGVVRPLLMLDPRRAVREQDQIGVDLEHVRVGQLEVGDVSEVPERQPEDDQQRGDSAGYAPHEFHRRRARSWSAA